MKDWEPLLVFLWVAGMFCAFYTIIVMCIMWS